jgi:7-cyano-7-deazaguanine reductase
VELSRVRLDCSEFTSHCPVTGQPDFAEVVIEYVPGDHIVETKSVKLWLQTWRSRSAFNEQIAVELLHAFVEAVNPISASVVARFKPRGGISVTATATTSNLA